MDGDKKERGNGDTMKKKRITKAICIIMTMISLLGATATMTSAKAQPRYGDPMYVIAESGINVRKSAGLSSKIVGTLSYGTQVNVGSVFGTKKDGYTWIYINSPKEGFVALEYLSYTRPRSIVINTTKPKMG